MLDVLVCRQKQEIVADGNVLALAADHLVCCHGQPYVSWDGDNM